MSTLAEITYDLLETVRGTSRRSDDDSIPLELIQYYIISCRARLIREDQAKGRSLSENVVQTIPCIPLIQVSASECCDVNSDCTILRTINKIPRPIEILQKDLITRVSGTNISGKGYSIIPYTRVQWAGSSRWTNNIPKAFYHNGYIYLINSPVLSKLDISGVFEDPRDAAAFANCSGAPCYSDDDQFPISGWMLSIMKDMILKNELRIAAEGMSDTKNDEKSDPQR